MAEGGGGNSLESPDSRSSILNAAVRFLQNPLVQKTSSVEQQSFLRSKGLSDDEVKLVLQHAASPENGMLAPPGITLPPPVPPRNYSVRNNNNGGSTLRDFIKSFIIICGFSYAIYHLYKKYLQHFLFGDQQRREDNTCPDDLYKAVTELHTSTKALNDSLGTLQEQLQRRQLPDTFASAKQVDDLKAEIASVKSLLLGRNQFAPPVLQAMLVPPSIPSWQLVTDTEGAKSLEEEEAIHDCRDDSELEIRTCGSGSSENDVVTTNGSDSSMEMISKNAC